MNLKVLKKTRRAPRLGDIFVMQPDEQFLFGRIVDTNANPLGVGGAVLIYIYRVRAAKKTPVPELLRGQLLVPPMMTNKHPWTKGYFEQVENRPLSGIERCHSTASRTVAPGTLTRPASSLPAQQSLSVRRGFTATAPSMR
jgi:hypothetical protein